MTANVLPYSCSSGSAFKSYDKLLGTSNYTFWRSNVRMTLITLRQWGIIDGSVTAPVAQDPDNPTADERKADEDWVVREKAAYAEILFRITDNIRAMMDEDMGAKELWDALEKRYSVNQEGMRNILMAKMRMARWDGNGPISAHRDYMVGLRTQIAQTGKRMSDEAFFDYFTVSLPSSMDVFIAMYEDQTFDVDHLCEKLTKFELRRARRDLVDGKGENENVAMYGHSASGSGSRSKGDDRRRRDFSQVTCFACGKKGHNQ